MRPYPATPYGPPYAPYPPAPMPPRNNTPWIVGGVIAAVLLIGLVATLLIALVAGLALGGVGTMRTSVSSRSFQVQGTPTVIVNNAAGNVHINAGNGSAVTVQITKHVRAGDAAAAQRGFNSIGANIAQQGDTVTITSSYPSGWMSGILSGGSVDYAITLPAGSTVRADVSAGNVTTSNVVFGPGSVLKTSAGNVTANGSLAPDGSLEVRVSAGNATVELPASTATHLSADVSVGNMTITGFPVQVSGSGVTGHHASGETHADPHGSLTVTVATGNVTITAR